MSPMQMYEQASVLYQQGNLDQAPGIYDRSGQRYQIRSCTVARFGQGSSFDIQGPGSSGFIRTCRITASPRFRVR